MDVLSFRYFQALLVQYRELWQRVVLVTLVTVLQRLWFAPLVTCSALFTRYMPLLIAAFIPEKMVWGIFNLQGPGAFRSVYGWDCECTVCFILNEIFPKEISLNTLLLLELPVIVSLI